MAIISNAVTIADAGAFSVSLGSMVHIKTLTASASATLSFVDGTDGVVLDSTYPIYKFEFINIHPANNLVKFQFNLSTDGGSNYNVTKHYNCIFKPIMLKRYCCWFILSTGKDLAQSTIFKIYLLEVANENDAHSGTMTLYNPSSTTFVKHFMSRVQVDNNNYAQDEYMAGYGNTTSAVDAIRFQYSSGNIDDGKIKLYGIKDS
jgi:hypothetical protein